MKMLMIVVDSARREELEVVLEEAGVVGYTELPQAAGRGTSGPRLGSRAFPRTSAVVFSVLSADELVRLSGRVREYCASCGEHLKMVAWDVEEVM